MPGTLLRTKLFIPPPRPNLVPRPHLIERLSQSIQPGHKLTLISAPAGFGKTTLICDWTRSLGEVAPNTTIAWLSLDEGDNDLARFLAYVVAALNQCESLDASFGTAALTLLQSPQAPPAETVLAPLINEISSVANQLVLVLDDYHLIDSQPVHEALSYLLEGMPAQMHLVIGTREDPPLPLTRMRARAQLSELRAADLRFTASEVTVFLNQAMGLELSVDDIIALETRTEGWITGLQLAALALQGSRSMQGSKTTSGFIKSFTGSHRFVLDYLVEEVLEQQSKSVQEFLLQTAVLNRLNGALCDALTGRNDGQQTLEMLEQTNLFIVPLDDQRQWYRYHHLFADLLYQRLRQGSTSSPPDRMEDLAGLHSRASQWYEDSGLELEAFQHAAAANDIKRAVRLIEGEGTPLYFRGMVTPILSWLASLPAAVLENRPSLWVTYAMTELTAGQTAGVEEKLRAAEAALEGIELDDSTRDLVGRIANARANLAVGHRQTESVITQSRRALAYLHPDNLTYRTATTWKLGVAYEFQGDWSAARQAFSEAIAISQATGNVYTQILATTGLGNIQLAENQLHQAAETYRHVLDLVGDLPIPVTVHVHLCLARINYEWNDLAAAQQHALASLQEAQPYKEQYDIHVACELFLARLKLAQGDVAGAAAMVAGAEQSARQYDFVHQLTEAAAVRVLTLLRQGNLAAAAEVAKTHDLPDSLARVRLAQGDPAAALAALEPQQRQIAAGGLVDERLKVMVLQAAAYQAQGEKERALQLLNDALALAEPGGLVRTFLDEGPAMARLLYEALKLDIASEYVGRLLAAFPAGQPEPARSSRSQIFEPELVDPLSEREVEVLQQIAAGLTNREIADRLYLALNTVKVHTRNIYGKLGVNNRTQAVARARVLGLLQADDISD